MMIREQTILLVEDNEDDAELALMAFHRAKITNRVVRARDGVEALDYLFGRGTYADRDVLDLPAVTLLDLKLPKIGGLEVLRAIRAEERTKHLPIVILTSSNEDKDRQTRIKIASMRTITSPTATWLSPWIMTNLWPRRYSWDFTGWC